ncbi:MAG: SGNH/GDSL hydrolase family protein [Jatrophihabitans sp.]|uniref:SGNH/GDSL hydrolase family protein n=1 Tax=Jatrophihabitans sp. TaxID=1932789 RepID=UPI003F7E5D85
MTPDPRRAATAAWRARLADRRVRRAALWGGAGVGAGVAGLGGLAGLLVLDTKIARRRIPVAAVAPPVSHDTVWTAAGVSARRPPIHIALLGDSTAAGYGAKSERETPAAQLATQISLAARRPVHVTNVAVVGAQSSQLPDQLARLDARRWPELALIMIGANDVKDRVSPADACRHLDAVVRDLVERGSEIIVSTCPDLGTVAPLPQPLRFFARRWSRQMARAQTVTVVQAGGRTVSMADLLGPIFATRKDLFAEDRFHPSAEGYAEAVRALLPSCLDALGLQTRARSASAFTTRRMKPVEKAAAQAVSRPGAEVVAAEPRTPWHHGVQARLRRRRPAGGLVD